MFLEDSNPCCNKPFGQLNASFASGLSFLVLIRYQAWLLTQGRNSSGQNFICTNDLGSRICICTPEMRIVYVYWPRIYFLAHLGNDGRAAGPGG